MRFAQGLLMALMTATTASALGCAGILRAQGGASLAARGGRGDDDAALHLTEAELLAQGCHWRGTAPFCNGECYQGECTAQVHQCGDGQCCTSGRKFLCCVPSRMVRVTDDDEREPPDSEYCGPGKIINCPRGATKNEDCECIPRDKLRAYSEL